MIQTIKKYLKEEIDIEMFDEVESTNNICKEIGKGDFNNTLIITRAQTGGRGRLGRSFISKKDKGIYMSLLLKPTLSLADVSKITCVVGTSILKVLSEYINERLYIKWVNDIYLHDKKICGILTESKIENNNLQYIIIGIGLNLEHQVFPEDVNASSIFDETGISIDFFELIGKLTNQILIDINDINNYSHVEYFKDHMYLINENVELLLQNRKYIGKVVGINDSFELITNIKGIDKIISSGEILKVSKILED